MAFNYNQVIRAMLEGDYQWAWLIDDDHVFPPNILLNLLERNKDVVTPFCLKREAPFETVVYADDKDMGDDRNYYKSIPLTHFRGLIGVYPLTDGMVNGSAGTLIKRHVCEALKDPWFENGKIDPEKNSWDLYFSKKANNYGFISYIDLDNTIGHITHMAVWPVYDNSRWKVNVTNA